MKTFVVGGLRQMSVPGWAWRLNVVMVAVVNVRTAKKLCGGDCVVSPPLEGLGFKIYIYRYLPTLGR